MSYAALHCARLDCAVYHWSARAQLEVPHSLKVRYLFCVLAHVCQQWFVVNDDLMKTLACATGAAAGLGFACSPRR